MEYLKLATVTTMVSDGDTTTATLLASVESGDIKVVNIKGLILTSAQVSSHLSGGVDGETLVRP